MKKITWLLIFAVSINLFACNYVTEPYFYERKFIEIIKETKLENKLYCDESNEKMVYLVEYEDSTDEDLVIGLVYNIETFLELGTDDIRKKIGEFSKDGVKIYEALGKKINNMKMTPKMEAEFPDNIIIKMYLRNNVGSDMIFAKYITDIWNNDHTFYFNSDYRDEIEEISPGQYYFDETEYDY